MTGNLNPVHLPEDMPEASEYVNVGPLRWVWRSGAFDGMPTMPVTNGMAPAEQLKAHWVFAFFMDGPSRMVVN